jgi:hypothetical protein
MSDERARKWKNMLGGHHGSSFIFDDELTR